MPDDAAAAHIPHATCTCTKSNIHNIQHAHNHKYTPMHNHLPDDAAAACCLGAVQLKARLRCTQPLADAVTLPRAKAYALQPQEHQTLLMPAVCSLEAVWQIGKAAAGAVEKLPHVTRGVRAGVCREEHTPLLLPAVQQGGRTAADAADADQLDHLRESSSSVKHMNKHEEGEWAGVC